MSNEKSGKKKRGRKRCWTLRTTIRLDGRSDEKKRDKENKIQERKKNT